MLEFHLVHVYACDTNLLVTFHNDTVIRFVIEIGRAVDVVHFHTKQVSDNYADFCQRFGKKAVDAKLAKETSYGALYKL